MAESPEPQIDLAQPIEEQKTSAHDVVLEFSDYNSKGESAATSSKGQDAELEAFLAEAFLAGLSTRDVARISEKHLGQKYDSKQVSRIVARATTELEPGGSGP